MSIFSFNIFTGISFCCEAFLELRFRISVRNFFLPSYLKENLLLLVSIRFRMLITLGYEENFSMHAKIGLSFRVILERCVSSLCIFKFLTIELNKFLKVFAFSVPFEIISSFSTKVIFYFDLILFEKRGEVFFQNFLLSLTSFTARHSK